MAAKLAGSIANFLLVVRNNVNVVYLGAKQDQSWSSLQNGAVTEVPKDSRYEGTAGNDGNNNFSSVNA